MSFHPFTVLAALLRERVTLSTSQTIQPWALRANTSLTVTEVQGDSCWLLVTVCLPCSHLEEQNVKTSLNVRPHVKLISPGWASFVEQGSAVIEPDVRKCIALSCACRTHEFYKPHSAPPASWEVRDLRVSPNCPVNSYPAASGCDLPGSQVTTWIEESWVNKTCPPAEQRHLWSGAQMQLWCNGLKLSAWVWGPWEGQFGPAASKPALSPVGNQRGCLTTLNHEERCPNLGIND